MTVVFILQYLEGLNSSFPTLSSQGLWADPGINYHGTQGGSQNFK